MKKTKLLVSLSLALLVACMGNMNPASAASKDYKNKNLVQTLNNFKDRDEDSFFSDIQV